MDLITSFAVLAVSLLVLVKSADFFIDSSETMGKWLGIPSFVIGVTIVALGTSLPELITALIAVYRQSSEIVLGNVVGSNIANILLILGISALFAKDMNIKWNIFHQDLPMFFASALMFCFVVWPLNPEDNFVTMGEGILLVAGYILYTFFALNQHLGEEESKNKKQTIKTGKNTAQTKKQTTKTGRNTAQTNKNQKTQKNKKATVQEPEELPWSALAILPLSMVGIFLGAKYTIDAVINISTIMKIGKEIIAISAVAIGTSLPELFVSVAAVRKKKYNMAFGNIVGSNIFNVFAVTGIPALYACYAGPGVIIPKSVNDFAMPFFMFTYILFLVVMMDKRITRMEGLALLLCYVLFIGKLFAFM